MKRLLAGVSIGLLVISGCSFTQAEDERAIFNEALAEAYRNKTETLNENRTAVSFESGRTVDTCDAYLKRAKSDSIAETVHDRIASAEYLVCDSVAALERGTSVKDARYKPSSYGKQLVQRLDVRAFPSSLGPRATDSRHVLADIAPDAVYHTQYEGGLNSEDWHWAAEVVATLDLNENGRQDWLLWLMDEARNGNYRGYRVLVAYDVQPTGLIQAEPLR